ncbi:MAG: substrate-binding domain-containing protein [Paenibacillaceae bacterium]
MKKIFVLTVSLLCAITFIFTIYYAYRVYESNMAEQIKDQVGMKNKTRIAMITQELESPFTKALEVGIERVVDKNNMNVSYWGTYHPDLNNMLKYMDIAIASKVDGIIVQAMDGTEFVQIVQKATAKGIPVITVGFDASPNSLRKTYVGPDHYKEGQIVGDQIANELNKQGIICIVSDNRLTSFEKLRLDGLEKVLLNYPNIKLVKVEANESEFNQSKLLVNRILNQYPKIRVLIGLNAEAAIGIERVLTDRSRSEEYSVYSFDDSPELREFVDSGQISATLTNDGAAIGEKSVLLLKQWIENIELPLPENVYTHVSFYKKKASS